MCIRDSVISGRYKFKIQDPKELAKHIFEDIDPDFAARVGNGDILVAGENFGCGSSREHAPVSIVACGVSCVIAASFARIFFRNAINIGLPIVESVEASERIRNKDVVSVDTERGIIRNLTRKESYRFEKYPSFMQRIIKAGGLMNSINRKRGR